MAKENEGGDLDDILNDALDAIDSGDEGDKDVDLKAAASAAANTTAETADEAAKAAEASAADGLMGMGGESLEESMKKLMEDMQNPEFAKSLDEAFSMLNLGGEGRGDEESAKALESLLGGAGGDEDIPETLKALAEAAQGLEGADPADAEKMGEEIMKEMMSQFEKMGKKEDFEMHVDNIMKQLVSKEVMYTPTKLVCEAFPEWLADNESNLSKEEYERYGKQYQYFQQMLAAYDTEPENSTRPMELLQEMQQYGQPPVEIIKKLAPGLEIGEDGMPNMGSMPGMPGMPGQAPGCPQM
mmetsp:Transcript_22976/g.29350  ORF Transcript_22976/g.29350 Transcript_22976/m.29350 type:complete len:299 (+) Transcript_22976:444-1340(+)|eukprot:CAMPEP_0204830204 /NCGR_PEP_ID=MMETSP1346-20131115/8395_1 /ASSEMBLY_ACC=CAM_ASM_000771 /TAXON_ID=215587 /ORGANISM="Aplanochytrium stocchinoi, Strain GSBS06" /LENGTH=298 /DNA_ID=CAMNT_0051960357 /DNA_START=546 /DNA_END=1442 /DNA_ORIENTATION=-